MKNVTSLNKVDVPRKPKIGHRKVTQDCRGIDS